MTSEGRAYSRFKRALASGNAMVSWAAALELEAITLHDALALLLLVGDSDQGRYEKAAVRWHARLCHEGRLSIREAQLALSALHALPAHNEPAARTLSAICEDHGLGDAAVVLEAWLARKGGELSPPQAYRR